MANKFLKHLLIVVLTFISFRALAQKESELNTMLANIKNARTPATQVDANFKLATYYFLINKKASDSIAFSAMAIGESSRDKKIIVHAYLLDALRFLKRASEKVNIESALTRTNKALQISRESREATLMVSCYNVLVLIYRVSGQPDNAIKSSNDAIALLPDVSNDSLKVLTYNSLAQSLSDKTDMLTAFKAHLNALTIAEESNNQNLIVSCYRKLEEFYISIENYEHAKDYAYKALAIHTKAHNKREMMDDYFGIARVYVNASDVEMAKYYFTKTEKLADSLDAGEYKRNVKFGLLNMYLNSNRFKEGYDFLKKNSDILAFLKNSGMQYELDKANGYIQMMLGHYDSSLYYYKKAEPFHETSATPYQRANFYYVYSLLYKKLKQWDKAIEYQTKSQKEMELVGDLVSLDGAIKNLDSLNYYAGNFKEAYRYEVLHEKYSDSLRKLSEQKDILGLEIDNENKRAERLKLQEEQEQVRRNNLQYMGITAAIAGIFIFLVVLGLFKVSSSVVKATGFFAFIFLFEFIIMLADNQIHHFTHGEPWKVWLIKIVLIALLLPFHHWIEKKVIHFLIEHQLLLTKSLDRFKFKKVETTVK